MVFGSDCVPGCFAVWLICRWCFCCRALWLLIAFVLIVCGYCCIVSMFVNSVVYSFDL